MPGARQRGQSRFTTGGLFRRAGAPARRASARPTWSAVTDMELLVLDAREFRSMLMTTPEHRDQDAGAASPSGWPTRTRTFSQLCQPVRHGGARAPSSTSFMRRSSLLIGSRLPAAAAATHVVGEAVGQRDPERQGRLAPAAVERLHHELLVGVVAARHAGGHERRGRRPPPSTARRVGARPAGAGRPGRTCSGPRARDARRSVAGPVCDARHVADVGVVARAGWRSRGGTPTRSRPGPRRRRRRQRSARRWGWRWARRQCVPRRRAPARSAPYRAREAYAGGCRMEAASRARSRERAVRSSPSSPSTSAAC